MVNANTRKTAKASRKIERHISALERVMTYQEKVHLMVIEVLREESGRELAAAARFNGLCKYTIKRTGELCPQTLRLE
jgi:hypothetical protein